MSRCLTRSASPGVLVKGGIIPKDIIRYVGGVGGEGDREG